MPFFAKPSIVVTFDPFTSTANAVQLLIDLPSTSACAFASPRLVGSIDCQSWMLKTKKEINQIWIAIGPEGGWTLDEQMFAKEFGCNEVQFGKSILRTSTAAVVATQLMVSWRRNSSLCI